MKRIKIFDTTLRDGEQSPGCSMNLNEKIEVAKQLEMLKVDIIEAGFAAASPGDAIRRIPSRSSSATTLALWITLPSIAPPCALAVSCASATARSTP